MGWTWLPGTYYVHDIVGCLRSSIGTGIRWKGRVLCRAGCLGLRWLRPATTFRFSQGSADEHLIIWLSSTLAIILIAIHPLAVRTARKTISNSLTPVVSSSASGCMRRISTDAYLLRLTLDQDDDIAVCVSMRTITRLCCCDLDLR